MTANFNKNINGSYDVKCTKHRLLTGFVIDLTEVTRCVKGRCAERAEESVGHVHHQIVVSCYQLIDCATCGQLRHI